MHKKLNINYEDVRRLYAEEGFTFKEIGIMYGCTSTPIRKIAKRHNIIPIRGTSKNRKILIQKTKIPLSLKETDIFQFLDSGYDNRGLEVILGALMGDSNIKIRRNKNDNKFNICFGHSIAQLEYLTYKRNMFPGEMVNPIIKEREERWEKIHGKWYKCKEFYTFSTHPMNLQYLFDLIIKNGIKTINRKFLSYLTPLSLAIWHMDDGSFNKCNRVLHFATMGFSRQEHEIMKDYFHEDLKMPCNFNKTDSGSELMLTLAQNATKKFIELTRPYMCKNMEYKFNMRSAKQPLRDFENKSNICE